jgi:hypothetical protein
METGIETHTYGEQYAYGEHGKYDGTLEQHLNSVHQHRLTDLMGQDSQALVRLHELDHARSGDKLNWTQFMAYFEGFQIWSNSDRPRTLESWYLSLEEWAGNRFNQEVEKRKRAFPKP